MISVVPICDSDFCVDDAANLCHWPGRTLRFCKACTARAIKVANAAGFFLTIEPLPVTPTEAPTPRPMLRALPRDPLIEFHEGSPPRSEDCEACQAMDRGEPGFCGAHSRAEVVAGDVDEIGRIIRALAVVNRVTLVVKPAPSAGRPS